MHQGRSTSTCTLNSSKSSSRINSNAKNIPMQVQNENIYPLNNNTNNNYNKNNQLSLQKEQKVVIESSSKKQEQSPFAKSFQNINNDKSFVGILQNSTNKVHQRSQSNLPIKYQNGGQQQQQEQQQQQQQQQLNATPSQTERQRRNKRKERQQLSEIEIKKANTLNFIQSMNDSQTSNNINNNSMNMGMSTQKANQNQMNDSNMYTFSKLNEIREQLKEQKDLLEIKQQQRQFLKTQHDQESQRYELKIREIKQMIVDEEEINQKQQMIIKEQPEMRLQAVRKTFINADKLFESLQRVNALFSQEWSKSEIALNHFQHFQQCSMPILGSLEKLFLEKQNIILKIYSNQDKLEHHSENRKMQQQDLEGYELRNIELALECDDLEAYIEMFKQNEDDCQIIQQINLRNVWMCLQNELHKVKQRIEETEQMYNDLDIEQTHIQNLIQSEVAQTKDFLSLKQHPSISSKERVEELSLKEYIRTVLNDQGREAYEEIECLFDGEKISQSVCGESYKQEEEEMVIFQSMMLNLIKGLQEVVIDELHTYCNKYKQLAYNGEQEMQFTHIKKELLSNLKQEYRNTQCGQQLEKMLDLNSLFSRIVINCKHREEVTRVQTKIIQLFSIQKNSFQSSFQAQKIFSNQNHSTDLKNKQLSTIQNSKLILLAKLDQMKTRSAELVNEIEKQEQNTIPFFITPNSTSSNNNNNYNNNYNNYNNYNNNSNIGIQNYQESKRSDDSYIFDDTTGHLNKTNITQTNNQVLIKALNDSHLINNMNKQQCNMTQQQQQQNSQLNNSHITICSYNNITKQNSTQTAISNNNNNSSFIDRSMHNNNNNNTTYTSLSPSTSKMSAIPPRNNMKNSGSTSQSSHYQIQYERKLQVDKIYMRMNEIKIQKDANKRCIRDLIKLAEKEYPFIEQLENDTKSYTTDLLNLNGMQKEQAEKLIQVYHRFFDDESENFMRKLERYILIQQEVGLNEYTPAMNFFFTGETLTPIGKLKLLDKKMEELKREEERQLFKWVSQIQMIDAEIMGLSQRIYQIHLLYNTYDISMPDYNQQYNNNNNNHNNHNNNGMAQNSCQSSCSSSAFGIGNDQSLNLSDIQGSTGNKMNGHSRINSSSQTGFKQSNNYYNESSVLKQQFGSSVFKQQEHQTSQKSSGSSPHHLAKNDKTTILVEQSSTTRYMNNSMNKLRIHNILIDQSNKESIAKAFNVEGEEGGISVYKMFQVNQGNLIKSQTYDPLTQRKHPSYCGYGLRKITLNKNEVVFYNTKTQSADLTIKLADFTNIFIPPVTLEIIKYQTMNSTNKSLSRISVKKFLEATYYPFALEVKQTGRIECLCDDFYSLKLIYTLFVAVLTQHEQEEQFTLSQN